MRKVVSNTTPLISLLSISKLTLLKDLYGQIIIPYAVYTEIEQGNDKPFYTDLSKIDWIEIKKIQNPYSVKYLSDLDEGEAEVIILANEIKADLILLDEKLARSFAQRLSITYTGTLGMLIKAKQQGLIKSVEQCIITMEKNGIWFSDSLINAVLKLAKEG
jgi:predicted nucleic acid-binding protein